MEGGSGQDMSRGDGARAQRQKEDLAAGGKVNGSGGKAGGWKPLLPNIGSQMQ